ncbi:hypothetical protein KDK_16320 [Dictyobacter kobayashii]|uniref:Uncharacterized protein n=1 Tax=Dictyobacter kobayashii TaxID=2014872 RepID=A0A402AFH8_9CHLR|nr:hypothetical protein KDK_16320 [Dictyobacter kobayashii]
MIDHALSSIKLKKSYYIYELVKLVNITTKASMVIYYCQRGVNEKENLNSLAQKSEDVLLVP